MLDTMGTWESGVRRQAISARVMMASSLVALGAAAMLFPPMAPWLLATGATAWGVHRIATRLGTKPIPEGAVFFAGIDRDTGEDIWRTNDEVRRHSLYLGTTGSGKTEVLLGTLFNVLATNSGMIYIDGNGDYSIYAKAYAMARRFGREDDVLVLNFMTGNQDFWRKYAVTNTLNPFTTGSADSLTQMVVSLMDDAGGDGAMWKGRATAMFTGVMRALTWLRDAGRIDLNVGTIRDYLNIKAVIDLADANMYPEMPPPVRKSVRSYLTSLPGYQEEKGRRQSQTTLDQHGYLEMQFTKILGSMADVYGHIFFTTSGDVDLLDVHDNRRIVIVMLPALEKSGDEIANLGKVVLAGVKAMMAKHLSTPLDGTWNDIVKRRPRMRPAPFHVCADEVAYYMPDGIALMAAQARSMGVAMSYAGSDIRSMNRMNIAGAEAVIANTATKVFLRQDAMENDEVESVKYGADAQDLRTLKPGHGLLFEPDRARNAEFLYGGDFELPGTTISTSRLVALPEPKPQE